MHQVLWGRNKHKGKTRLRAESGRAKMACGGLHRANDPNTEQGLEDDWDTFWRSSGHARWGWAKAWEDAGSRPLQIIQYSWNLSGALEEEGMKIQGEANHEDLVGPAKRLRLSPAGCVRTWESWSWGSCDEICVLADSLWLGCGK